MILLCVLTLSAQQTSATLLGTVVDTSGASIPNVTIRVVNLGTNIKREAVTDPSGNYSLTYLPAGKLPLDGAA